MKGCRHWTVIRMLCPPEPSKHLLRENNEQHSRSDAASWHVACSINAWIAFGRRQRHRMRWTTAKQVDPLMKIAYFCGIRWFEQAASCFASWNMLENWCSSLRTRFMGFAEASYEWHVCNLFKIMSYRRAFGEFVWFEIYRLRLRRLFCDKPTSSGEIYRWSDKYSNFCLSTRRIEAHCAANNKVIIKSSKDERYQPC